MASIIACIILFCFIGFAIGVYIAHDFDSICAIAMGIVVCIACGVFDITFERFMIGCFVVWCFLSPPILIYELIEQRKKNSV